MLKVMIRKIVILIWGKEGGGGVCCVDKVLGGDQIEKEGKLMERKIQIRMEIVDLSSKIVFIGFISVLFEIYCLGEDYFLVNIIISFVLLFYVSMFQEIIVRIK